MKILVTGAAGFIGSHVCVALLESGFQLVALDNFSNSAPDVLERVRQVARTDFSVERADVRDATQLEKIFALHQPDAIVHLAGLKSVGDSVRAPIDYYETNVGGSIALLQTCQAHGVSKLLFSSSATVYSASCESPIAETASCIPYNPYGETKHAVELLLAGLAASATHWSLAALRYFNVAGAHPGGMLGEAPSGRPANLCPLVAQTASGRRDQLEVYGGDYPTRDGTCERDYIHVMDLAVGHVRALGWLFEHTGFESFNLGCGHGYTVLEVIAAFEKACGKRIPYAMHQRRPGDIARYFADPGKAERLLGWRARLSIGDVARDAWRWESRGNSIKPLPARSPLR